MQLAATNATDGGRGGAGLRMRAGASGLGALLLLCVIMIAVQSGLWPSIHRQDRLGRHHTHLPDEGAFAQDSPLWEDLSRNSSSAPRLRFPLWWAAPFFSDSGYATEALAFILGLVQTGRVHPNDVYITHGGDHVSAAAVASMDPAVLRLLRSLEWSSQKKTLPAADLARTAIVVCHSFPDTWQHPDERQVGFCPDGEMLAGRIAYLIGRTMFETNRLPDHLLMHLEAMDEVWVPSQWNVDTFVASGFPRRQLFSLPQSVNLTTFDRSRTTPLDMTTMARQLAVGSESAASTHKKRFTFVSVFKWEIRKGWDVLLHAFLLEFKPEEDVDLLIVTHAYDERVPDWPAKIRKAISHCSDTCNMSVRHMPRVYVASGRISDADLPRLYKACDAMVVPTRGEGWGRPQIEAMAMEMAVISTNWSGSTAFMNSNNSYLLHYNGLQQAGLTYVDHILDTPFNLGFFAGSQWAIPSHKHLRTLMRRIVQHPEEAHRKGVAARQDLVREFSPEAVTQKLYHQLTRVQRLLVARTAREHRAHNMAAKGHNLR